MIPGIPNKIAEGHVKKSLTDAELNEIKSILLQDKALTEENRLSVEIDEAMGEKDIISLNSQLKNITSQPVITSGNGHLSDAEAYFGLSEEVYSPVSLSVEGLEQEIGNYLQKLHLKNHAIASKEIVHDLFTEMEENLEAEHQMMSTDDEFLFEDVRFAVTEKEIIDLRANLQSIAQCITVHERTFEEIEDLVSGELDEGIEKKIRAEATMNATLSGEIVLHGEISSSIEETDIMKLRNGLKVMMRNENSHSRSIEEMDNYLNDEMDELALAQFEVELMNNPGLAADLAFHKDVNNAITETDVMSLRTGLQRIFREEMNRESEKLGVGSHKQKNLLWYAVASSVVLMLTFSSLLKQKVHSTDQLYASYYQPYTNGANVSRSAVSSANEMNSALREIDKGNYPSALKMLRSASATVQDGFSISFYSGVAYQGLGDYNNAISSFTEVVRNGDNLLVEQSEWYIGLCYLRVEEREKALAQFRSIVSRNGFYQDQSRKLLKQLE